MPQPTEAQITINERDLEYSTCRGSGAGGQHRNVTDSAVILKHLPTGLTVRCEAERSQHLNKETALSLLRARLWEAKQQSMNGARAEDRKNQIGSGQRGDKTWSIRVKDDVVTHHPSGKQFSYKNYVRGIYEV